MLAAIWDAQEEAHPATLPAADLARAGYLRSFPHQATFAVHLDRDDGNLGRFIDEIPEGGEGNEDEVKLSRTAPVREVLTPAACYHLYLSRRGTRLDSPCYLTTRNTCFRTEDTYAPLRRQRSFTMREIVCIGPAAEVDRFLETTRAAVQALLAELALPVSWLAASDPFFRPFEQPGYLMQRIAPVKREAVYQADGTQPLAISSVNRHNEHFGLAFSIEAAGQPAASGCVAFGLERWLLALTGRHGYEPHRWPSLAGAAERIMASGRWP